MLKKGAKLIIRPPQSKYDIDKLPLVVEVPNFGEVQRTSIPFSNEREQTMYGSLYKAPKPLNDACVIYLHGNASNQLEGRFLVSLFCPIGISVFCFDFAGCGCSEGKYISLGYFEAQDLNIIIDMLESQFGFQQFILWGRSMGATVSILALESSDKIKAAVADSPYISIKSLVKQLGRARKVPDFIIKSSTESVRNKVSEKANFDIYDVSPLEKVNHIKKPILFIHGIDDKFVIKKNSEILFSRCSSEYKEILLVPGEHDSNRPAETIKYATTFLCKAVGIIIQFSKPLSSPNSGTNLSINKDAQNSSQHFNSVNDMFNKMKKC